jgi:tyrosyl-tRNA synthetase
MTTALSEIAGIPQISLQKSHLSEGVSLAELLVLAGLAVNRDAARTLIARGETCIDDRPVDNAMERVRLADGAIRLSAGAGQVLLKAV